MTRFLAELHVWDPDLEAVRVLRYADKGFTTSPTDSPPNEWYDERIREPAAVNRTAFGAGRTVGRSQIGVGDLVLNNPDGELDDLIDYGFDGRRCVILAGDDDATTLSQFRTLVDVTMEGVSAGVDRITVKLRDRQQELDIPLQSNKYAGDNSLPDGLEGTADDLKGKPKPRCFGVVKNVPAVNVNTAKLIYQVNDGPISSLDAVYDRGIRLEGGVTAMTLSSAVLGGSNDVNVLVYAPEIDTVIAAGDGGLLSYSTDEGVSWNSATSNMAGQNINGGAWDPKIGLFFIAGNGGTISTSPDGITWTSRTSGTSQALRAAGAGAGLFLVGGASGFLATSTDGITWDSQTSPHTVHSGFAYGSGPSGPVYVSASTDNSATDVATSPDGVTWTARTSTFGASGSAVRVAYGNGTFVICGSDGASPAVATSDDGGVTWVNRGDGEPTVATVWNELAYTGDRFLIGSDVAGDISLSESDGISWKRVDNPSIDNVDSIVKAQHKILIGQNDGDIWYSTGLGTYADVADLLDDSQAPQPGTAKYHADSGLFRLGALPDGEITADVTQGASSADRTPGRVLGAILSDPLGAPLVEYSRSDVETLDTAAGYEIGFYTDAEITVAEALDQVAASVGAWWGPDRTGVFRIKQLLAPSGSPAISLTENDIVRGTFHRTTSPGDEHAIPTWRTIVRYAQNYTVQDNPAFGVAGDRRAFIRAPWRESVSEDVSVQVVHPLARQTTAETLLVLAADAASEASRRQTLRGTLRHRFELQVQLTDETDAIDMGDVIQITHPRYGFSGGALFLVIGVQPRAKDRRITWTVWR